MVMGLSTLFEPQLNKSSWFRVQLILAFVSPVVIKEYIEWQVMYKYQGLKNFTSVTRRTVYAK